MTPSTNTQVVYSTVLPNPIPGQDYIPFNNSMGSRCLPNPIPTQDYIPFSNSMGSHCLLDELVKHEIAKRELMQSMQRDFTRKYHAEIAQQELAFRHSLSHLYYSSSQHEVLQKNFSKKSSQILQPNSSKNLQQTSSRSPDSVLPERPGWSSLCEVVFKTEVLEKHNLVDKHQLMSEELKECSGNGREGNSKEQKTQTEQQQQERDIIDNFEQQETKMKIDCTPSNEHERLSNSSPLLIDEHVICNKVFNFQDDFESHLAGRKHVERLEKIKDSKVLSDIKDDSKKCVNAGGKELISIESGLPANGDVEKSVKNKLVWKVKDNRDLVAKNEKVGVQENTELNEQQQLIGGGMTYKICERLSNSSELCIKECKILNIKDDTKSAKNKFIWKGKDHRDLESKSNKFEVKKNAELNEQLQTGEGNLDQQKSQTEQQMKVRNSKQQKPHMEQQMMEGGIPSKEHERSMVLNFQVDLEAHLAGRKHVKCLKKIESRPVWKVTDDRGSGIKSDKVGMKETAELIEQEQMNRRGMPSMICKRSSNSRQLSIKECKISIEKDDVEKCAQNQQIWKGKVDRDLGTKHKKIDKKENAELNEQCLMKEEKSKQQKPQMEQQLKERNSKQQKSQMGQQLKEGNSKQQKLQMEQQMMERGISSKEDERLLNLNQFKGCKKCNIVLNFQVDLEAHLAGKKHAKHLKKMENEHIWKVTDDKDLGANKVGMKETAELNEQHQMKGSSMPSKICKRSSNSSQISIDECEISIAKDDVDKCAKIKSVWNVKDNKDLGAESNMLGMKDNMQLNEQLWIKETNSKQQKPQTEQLVQAENIIENLEKREEQMMEGGVPSKEHESSYKSQSTIKVYMRDNKVFNFQADIESFILEKMENKSVWKNKDDRDLGAKSTKVDIKKNAELNEEQLIKVGGVLSKICKRSSDSSELSIKDCKTYKVKDDMETSAKNKPVWKVEDDRDLSAKSNNAEMMKENAELNEQQQMKEGGMPMKICIGSLNSSQLNINECKVSDKLSYSRAKRLEKLEISKAFSGFKDDCKECANADSKNPGISDYRSLVNYNVGMKETAELNEQHQMKGSGMPSKICKRSSNSSQLSISECKISIAKDDVDNCAKKKSVWNVKDNMDSGAESNMLDMKDNMQLNEQLQIKETNSKQQKPQTEQQVQAGNIIDKLEKIEEQMKVGGIPSKEHESSYKSQSTIKGCMINNTVFNFQADIESCLFGKKHAKQLKKMENKLVWKIKDDRDLRAKSNKIDIKKIAELNEQQLMEGGGMLSKICKRTSNSSKLSIKSCKFKDAMEKSAKNKPVQKVEDDRDLSVESNKAEMKENSELNEQQQMKEAGMPSKICIGSLNSSQLNINECKVSNKLFYSPAKRL